MPIPKPLNAELSFFLFVFRFYSPSKKFWTSLLISIQTFQCFSSHNWRKFRQTTLDWEWWRLCHSFIHMIWWCKSKWRVCRWRKIFFPLCHECGTKKKLRVPMRNRISDLRILHSNALPLSHSDLAVSEVYYEVHMTCVLHTVRISNVDSVMFLDRK